MVDRGYARISLDTGTSGSIEKQCADIAKAAGGEVAFYCDESVSGSKVPFAQRPEGARLLADLRAGDRVLVTKIDRAARNVRDLLNVVERIESAGASVRFIEKGKEIDTSGPMGEFTLVLLGAIAQLEAGIIAERRRGALEAFRTTGRHAVGRAPFGFVSVPRIDGRGLVIRPEWDVADGYDKSPAQMVCEAITRVLAGESQNEVRQSLDQRASVSLVKRHEAKVAEAAANKTSAPDEPPAVMSKTGFHKLLNNPRLAGMTPDGDGVVMVDGSPRIDHDAALLSMAEWDELVAYLARREPKGWTRREGFGGVLSCGICGGRMYVNVSKARNKATGATHDTYTCNRANHEPGERAPSVMVHKADAYLEQTFLALFGGRRAVRAVTVNSSAARIEAISTAKIALTEAQRRFAAALDEEAEAVAVEQMSAAKAALRAAEAMPDERTVSTEETGSTVAEYWAGSALTGRSRLLRRAGTWTVHVGRLPIDQKITLDDDELLAELLVHPLGSDSSARVDGGGYLI